MHTQLRAKRFALAAAVLCVLAAPTFVHANETQAMNACLRTFLDSDLAKDRKVTVQQSPGALVRPIALSGLYRIEVVARGRESGKRIARIVCHADSTGTIVAVNGNPTSAVASTVLASAR